jgi:alginate O-acetyltransferase complex protein AlgI
MLFNSYVFIVVFLPLVLLGWWMLPSSRQRLVFLTVASYFFYGWWSWKFLPVMIASTTVDYIAGKKIFLSEDPRIRKLWLFNSLAFNLSILGFFKYADFFSGSLNESAARLGWQVSIPLLKVILPIGISFYTFNSMSYTIDLYRGVVRPAKSVLHFSAFVAMFPHLIAGPIVRFSDIETQFAELKKRLGWSEAARGLTFFILGLGKKLLIADRLAPVVNSYFADPGSAGTALSWFAVLAYSLQLYFDFSGYSDMAVGLAHLLGITFPQNFNSPYKAENISDFWRRWHISLSTWLRDYLFIPLGGSRGSNLMTMRNLVITMFLGGLWHGANWTFVVWGLYHGALLALHGLTRKVNWLPQWTIFARSLTFICVVLGWVIFRSDSLHQAATVFRNMFGHNGIGTVPVLGRQLLVFCVAAALSQVGPNTFELEVTPSRKYALALALIFILSFLYLGKTSDFLYFQF